MSVSAHATTSGMTGDGFYNANSEPQWRATEAILPWLTEASESVPVDEDPLTLADYGCSEGANSIAVLSHLIGAIRPRYSGAIRTVHSDLPTNDFSQLFLKLRTEAGQRSLGENVFPSAVAGSMYEQLLPSNTVSFASTFNAIGFLSRRPVPELPNYILPNGPSEISGKEMVSDELKSAFSRQASEDVASFLKVRAAELVTGGKLLVQVFGCTDDARTCDGIYDVLNDAVLEYVERGDISNDTYRNYYQPVYFRTLDELLRPVEDPVFGLSSVYSCDKASAYEVSVPFNEDFEGSKQLEAYARSYVDFFRAFTEPVLIDALPDAPTRSKLVDAIYERAVELVASNRERYPFRYASVAMLLTKM